MEDTLFYGDNLDILRHHLPNESVDLIYLDPPFNSKADYNILFKETSGIPSEAQITAFEDTWHWTEEAERTFLEIAQTAPANVVEMMNAFRSFVGNNDMMAYLTMMCIRLLQLRRVLKSTGSIYLHCDPTASHYLKILLDSIFGKENFKNEIIWRRTGSHNKTLRYGPIHDVILFYTKTGKHTWNFPKRPYMNGHVEQNFTKDEKGYRTNYYGNVLTGSGQRGGESGKPWRGFNPTPEGRHWAVPKALLEDVNEDMSSLSQHEKLDRLFELGFIKIVPGQKWPIYERYLNDNDGQYVSDIWAFQPYTEGTVFRSSGGIDSDVRWLSPKDQERLGYPTQKPESLLERIIKASSNKGDIVLDPFCGCGTTVTAAHRLRRTWLGIDVTHLAINLIKWRLRHMFSLEPQRDYKIFGEPGELSGAEELASQNRFQFQWWALSLIDARPYGDKKQGKDTGIDGYVYFMEEKRKIAKGIVSVKSGKAGVRDVRDLGHVMDREKAEIGIFLTLKPPTRDMKKEAVAKGFYHSKVMNKDFPRMQILTIEELLKGRKPELPSQRPYVKEAVKADTTKELKLDFD